MEMQEILDELCDTDDRKELAMRLAYFIVQRDKHFVIPKTDYNIEEIIDPLSQKSKMRITIEYDK